MPRVCTICAHLDRAAIDRALVAGEASFRNIAEQFGVSVGALDRHKKAHLSPALVQAKAAQELRDAVDVMAELERCFTRMNLLFDACDRWLRDPEDPTRYDLGPRAEEVDITYTERAISARGIVKTVRRKKKLSELLADVEAEGVGRQVVLVETKHADPRELVVKTANRLQGQIELLARLLGELQDGDTVNILVSPVWVQVRSVIIAALREHPEARQAVAAALATLEAAA